MNFSERPLGRVLALAAGTVLTVSCGGDDPVAGGAVIEKDDVAGLLTADVVVSGKHFLDDIPVTDGASNQTDSPLFQGQLQSEVAHDGGDHALQADIGSWPRVPHPRDQRCALE